MKKLTLKKMTVKKLSDKAEKVRGGVLRAPVLQINYNPVLNKDSLGCGGGFNHNIILVCR